GTYRVRLCVRGLSGPLTKPLTVYHFFAQIENFLRTGLYLVCLDFVAFVYELFFLHLLLD
ncbi:hypothetical protein, partial [Enterococcus lactis]|uniref:hypothetical protein n=1 Tax=Enterococcus lactis TaxID=357441 RepID=UPI0019552D75